jgi:hypothetical protein
MFSKGPQPGYSPKSEALAICPTLICKRKTSCGITGYVVHSKKGGLALSSSKSVRGVWEKVLEKLINGQVNL